MSKGDEYAKVMPQILAYMYEQGVIGREPPSVLNVDAIAEKFGLELTEAASVMQLLKEQGNVTGRYGGYYRLTGPGFELAERLSKSKKFTWARGAAE